MPKGIYTDIVERIGGVLVYSTLMGHANSSFEAEHVLHSTDYSSGREWLSDFRRLVGQVGTTSYELASVLSILASSLMNGQSVTALHPGI